MRSRPRHTPDRLLSGTRFLGETGLLTAGPGTGAKGQEWLDALIARTGRTNPIPTWVQNAARRALSHENAARETDKPHPASTQRQLCYAIERARNQSRRTGEILQELAHTLNDSPEPIDLRTAIANASQKQAATIRIALTPGNDAREAAEAECLERLVETLQGPGIPRAVALARARSKHEIHSAISRIRTENQS